MVICSTPGCDKQATLTWERLASDDETGTALDAMRANLAAINEHSRLSLRYHIAELETLAANIPETLSPIDQEALRARIAVEITKSQAEHDAITDQVDLQHHLPMMVLVGACDVHAPEPDEATP